MKKAIIIDWLDKYGGAEKVIQAIEKVMNFDEIHCLVNIMNSAELKKVFPNNQSIKTSYLQFLGKRFRFFYPFFFGAIKKIKVSNDVCLIFSSSHSVAKGVLKSNANQIHISYFQAPNSNYIWQDAQMYFKSAYPLIKPFLTIFRRWDFKDGQIPDYIIVNSEYVKNWVKKNYSRESTIIYPPVDLAAFPFESEKKDYYVVAGRIATIKRFDLVIKAFNENNKELYVIGDGDELEQLKKRANSTNIHFLGFQKVEVLSKFLQQAKGFIQMGVEGFGIAAIESQSCGTPVLYYNKGGVTETVIDGITGLSFDKQNSSSLNECIQRFEAKDWNHHLIHNHAQKFSTQQFEEKIKQFVNKVFDKEII